MISDLLDLLGAACVMLGAFLCLAASVGLARFPDVLSRMHAATKPQVLGLWLILVGLGFRLRAPEAIGILVLIGLFQLLTTPVANHMVGRASFRAGQVREDHLVVNDLSGVLPGREDPRGAP